MRTAVRISVLTVALVALWVLSSLLPANDWGRPITVAIRLSGLYGLGITWTFALWPTRELDPLERGALAFALSLALLSFGVFGAARLGITASQRSFTLTALVVDVLGLVTIWVRELLPSVRRARFLRP